MFKYCAFLNKNCNAADNPNEIS